MAAANNIAVGSMYVGLFLAALAAANFQRQLLQSPLIFLAALAAANGNLSIIFWTLNF
ncbi:hypothetical protein THIOSC15_1150003 [uncultured Thiomicrorhabdus sp.]